MGLGLRKHSWPNFSSDLSKSPDLVKILGQRRIFFKNFPNMSCLKSKSPYTSMCKCQNSKVIKPNLLSDGGHKKAGDRGDCRDGPLLLLLVDRLDLVLRQRLPGFRNDLDDVVDADETSRRDVLAVAVRGAADDVAALAGVHALGWEVEMFHAETFKLTSLDKRVLKHWGGFLRD